MKNILKNILALLILGIVVFVFRDSLEKSFFVLQDKYFPCTRTITYSLGTFDPNFGISQEEFLNRVKEGEDMWETVVHKNLFTYTAQGGELTVNLIYDNRQESTNKLKEIDQSLDYKKSSYESLKNELDTLQKEYKQKKDIFESKVISLKDREGRYSAENIALLNNLQAELNNYVPRINSLVDKLNASATSFNSQAKDYNTVSGDIGEEFEEGIYRSDKNGKEIDIYQFENKNQLTRVLMHELGHALFLEHVDNPEAIMYRLNSGTSLIPTDDDINALRAHCGEK